MEVCIRCGYSAAGRPSAGGQGLGFLFLVILVGAAGFAIWWFFLARPSPLVGSWKKGGIVFTFQRDGQLHSNGLFEPDGTFLTGTRKVTSRWRTAGNRLTLIPQGTTSDAARDVQWEINGRTLTLKGVDGIGTIRSTLRLTRTE